MPKNKNSIQNTEDEMSDTMMQFMTDSIQCAVTDAIKNLGKNPQKEAEKKSSTDCVICLDAPADWLIVPCGHKVCCETCGKTITKCPICRSSKEQLVRVYM